MENLSHQQQKQQLKSQSTDNLEKSYLTSENSPELKAAMNKISSELLERNKNLYRRLANAC